MIEIIPALEWHIEPIADAMRAMDRQECAAFGRGPAEALKLGMDNGEAWTVFVDGEPHAMFGLVIISVLGGEARPWMLGTDEVYRQGRAMLTLGKHRLERLFDEAANLSNFVSVSNVRAKRLLRRWGFEISSEVQSFGGVPFQAFYQSRVSNSCRA